MGLNHLPSGRFAANGAWLAVQVMAHNLARWTAHRPAERDAITAAAEKRGPRKPSAESMAASAYAAAMRGEREANPSSAPPDPTPRPQRGGSGIRPVVADAYSTTLATAS